MKIVIEIESGCVKCVRGDIPVDQVEVRVLDRDIERITPMESSFKGLSDELDALPHLYL